MIRIAICQRGNPSVNKHGESQAVAMTATSARSNRAYISLSVLISFLLAGCISQEAYEKVDTASDDLSTNIDRSLIHNQHAYFQEEGTTELMLQSARGDTGKVQAILDNGVNPNEMTINGYTALMFAASLRCEQQAVLSFHQCSMEAENSAGLQDNC